MKNKLTILFILISYFAIAQDPSPLPSQTIIKLIAPNTPTFYYNPVGNALWIFKGSSGWLRISPYYDTKERIDSIADLYRIPEAPFDHKIYGRSDSTWVEITSTASNISEIFNETPSGFVNGINTKFVLDTIPVINTERVFLNGIRQLKLTDYLVTSDTIDFNMAPELGDLITVDYMKKIPSIGNYYFNIIPTGDIDGNNTIFSVANDIEPPTSRIYLNGIRQFLTTDYTVSGNIITFVVAPEINDILIVDYINKP